MATDYNKYSKQNETQKPEKVVEPVQEENLEIVTDGEEIIKDIESDEKTEVDNSTEQEETSNEDSANEDQIKVLSGTVVDCGGLNIRKKPEKDSSIIGLLSESDIVEIDEEDSEEDWYSIKTENGIEGFCMKKYIKLI